MRRTSLLLASVVLAPACAGDAAGPTLQSDFQTTVALSAHGTTVVMTGLNSPRGLDWSPSGALYVAEAGTSEVTGACMPFMEGPTLTARCYSGTGSIARLWKGRQERIVTGLPSSVILSSGFASGPQAVSFAGGHMLVTFGWGGHPDTRAQLGAAASASGTLVQMRPSGTWRVVADVAAFEAQANPAGGLVDSNPYGVLAEAGHTYVADAGGNSLLEVAANGTVTLVATFPATFAPPPFNQAEAVPTRVRRGPDGALYVSTLSGVPYLDGSAAIYRVVPGAAPTVYASGFKMITDFAFAPDGGLYVLQFATGPIFLAGPGVLFHVAADGTRSVIAGDLTNPTGLAIGPDGALYVSNRGTASGTGEVLRIVP